MNYRRLHQPGGTYFFTLVTFNRQPILKAAETVNLLQECFQKVMQKHPFQVEALVILPDHLHALWVLPEGDSDYPMRWRLIKSQFSHRAASHLSHSIPESRSAKGEQAVWQRRYWEHLIHSQADFNRHVEYIHYNPVKHGYVSAPADWPHSTFHQFVEDGVYPLDWGRDKKPSLEELQDGE
jgi:putative transposase